VRPKEAVASLRTLPIWAAIGAAIGIVVVVGGYALLALNVVKLGLPVVAWQGIGALIFLLTVVLFVSISHARTVAVSHAAAPSPPVAPTQRVAPSGPSTRELVKEWYLTDGQTAYRAARDLTEYVARHAQPSIVTQLLRDEVVEDAWNLVNPFQRAIESGTDTFDTALLLRWGTNYRRFLWWSSQTAFQLRIPLDGVHEFDTWTRAHTEMERSLTALLARDAFDSIRNNSVWEGVRARYQFR
jgi:hypothetical protein